MMKNLNQDISHDFDENNIPKLQNEINDLNSLHDILGEFTVAIGKLGDVIENTISSPLYESVTSKAEELSDTLLSLDDMYKSFFESGYLTQNIESSIVNLNAQIENILSSIQNLQDSSLQNEIVSGLQSLNNDFDNSLSDISTKLTYLVNAFKKSNSKNVTEKKFSSMENNIINSMSEMKENLINEMFLLKTELMDINTRAIPVESYSPDTVMNNTTSSLGFKRGNFLYYISELNNNKIHIYNLDTDDETVFSEIVNIDNEIIPYKNVSTKKVSNIILSDLHDYLLILTELKNNLNLLNFTTGKQIELFKHCLDFIYHNEYLYALLHNKFVKYDISTNRFVESFELINSNVKLSGYGKLDIIDNLILIKLDMFSYIYNPVSNKIIKLS